MARTYVTEDEWFKRMFQSHQEGKLLAGYVVFSNANVAKGIWRAFPDTEDGMWPIEERTYRVYNNCKYFDPEMGGNSIFAENLAETDYCKLSDLWFHNGKDNWIEEAFYFEDEE